MWLWYDEIWYDVWRYEIWFERYEICDMSHDMKDDIIYLMWHNTLHLYSMHYIYIFACIWYATVHVQTTSMYTDGCYCCYCCCFCCCCCAHDDDCDEDYSFNHHYAWYCWWRWCEWVQIAVVVLAVVVVAVALAVAASWKCAHMSYSYCVCGFS